MTEHADPIARDLDALRETLADWLDEIADLDDAAAAAAVAEMRGRIERITL